jgi:hypothetical protein
MSVKVQLTLGLIAAADNKTTGKAFLFLQVSGEEELYLFPPEYQKHTDHKELCELPVIKNAFGSMKTRGSRRTVKVTLSSPLKELYFDDDENVRFKDYYFEDVSVEDVSVKPTPKVAEPVSAKPMQTLLKDAVLEKFNGKNTCLQTWIGQFERECDRLRIESTRRPEALRLFLDGSAADWYTLKLRQVSLTDSWERWRSLLIETYGDRGWNDIEYSLDFKYIKGTLQDYVTKKLNLLLDLDATMSLNTQILLTVHGLPPHVKNRLPRKEIKSQESLINEIIQLESLVVPRKNKQGLKINTQNNINSNINNKSNEKKKPCTLCEKKGYNDRVHPEDKCWFNPKNKDDKFAPWNRNQNVNKNVKLANNVELEEELNNEKMPKN